MRLKDIGETPVIEAHKFIENCKRGACKQAYIVPLPNGKEAQFYVSFGARKPQKLSYFVIDRCKAPNPVATTPGCYIVAHNGSGWYGVFKQFDINLSAFILVIEADFGDSINRYVSEEMGVVPDCIPIGKVSVCYPDNLNSLDLNGIFSGVGKSYGGLNIDGKAGLRYRHTYYLRDLSVVEVSPAIEYKANRTRTFSSKLTRGFETRSEAIPGWYMNYFLAVHLRGNFFINDIPAMAVEINYENILEAADLWKPWVRLEKKVNTTFGCKLPDCGDDVCVCVPPTITTFALPEAQMGVQYNAAIPFTGSLPMTITGYGGPSWLTVSISGNNLIFSGVPDDEEELQQVKFYLGNECGKIVFDSTIHISPCVGVGVEGLILLPTAYVGLQYNATIYLTGTPPFSLISSSLPGWLTASLSGNVISLAGNPSLPTGDTAINIRVGNCNGAHIDIEEILHVEVADLTNLSIYNNATSGVIDEVSPLFFLPYEGELPLLPDQFLKGDFGGWNTAIMVKVSGSVFGKRLLLKKNNIVVKTKNIQSVGWYDVNFSPAVVFYSSDKMQIELID